MKKKEQKSGNKFWRASCHSARPRQYKTSYVQNLSTYTKLLSKTIFISTLVHTCTQGITGV